MTGQRILEALHGHAGVLAAAALLHPALLLRKGAPLSWRSRLAVGLTVVMALAAFGSGLVVYGTYVARVRTGLFLLDPRAGLLFETKEHVAFAVTAMTAGAGTTAFFAPRDARELRRAAAAVFATAAALCLGVTALGTYVASVHGFGAVR